MTVRAFYDDLSAWYHLIYADWDASIARQGAALAALIAEYWPGTRQVRDVAVGIGTQALGLAARGYHVVGSDLSPEAVERAGTEAQRRGLLLPCYAADFQRLPLRSAEAEVIICCDNSLPHLDTAAAVGATLGEWYRCLRPGGGCLLSMRDYGTPPPAGTVEVHPYGERTWAGRRYELRQVWSWQGPRYEVSLELTPLDGGGGPAHVVRTSYLAIALERVQQLMRDAGSQAVHRLDGRFFQPVLVGVKSPVP